MTPTRADAASMRVAVAAIVAVPWLPFVTVGRQPYSAGAFASRIGELQDLSVIDGSWARPAQLAMVATLLAAIAVLSWGRLQLPLTIACSLIGLLGAALGYFQAAQSDLLSAAAGMALLLTASALGLIVSAAAGWPGVQPQHTPAGGLVP